MPHIICGDAQSIYKFMEKTINVRKRDGSLVPFSVDNINKVISWAVDGLTGVNTSDIEMNAKLNIADGISTKEIHRVLVDSAANLFSEDAPNYQWVAGRLLNYQLRKDVWGGKNPPKLYDPVSYTHLTLPTKRIV